VPLWDAEWHARLNMELAALPDRPVTEQAAIRRALGADPVAFAIIYFSHHLKDASGEITFSEIHYEWARIALSWRDPDPAPQSNRHAVVGPRESGKSTWWFLILPMWAAANGYSRFAAAFASATTQAESHLLTMRSEMDGNAVLIHDYPGLCTPMRRRSGGTVADRGGMIHMRDGFVFAAKGMDCAMLGMKIAEKRPDLLIFDDIEPDEAVYSADQATKRLGTLTDAAFPLNIRANVVMVGTVTMPGSIMHQCVRAVRGAEIEDWIADERVQCHHYEAILTDNEGAERSIWPAKWPLEWLQSIRHTRSYSKNYANDPLAREGVYWVREDFVYGDLDGCTKTGLFIDPAVTTKKTSDFTGLAVVSFRPAEVIPVATGRLDPVTRGPLFRYRTLVPAKCVVRYSRGVRLTGKHLRDFVVGSVLPRHPAVRMIFVESNQGGDLWGEIFSEVPGIRVVQHNSSTGKEIRFGEALEYWQRHRVHHAERFDVLEEQAVGFPKAAYDDVIDAAVSGVRYFMLKENRPVVQSRELSTV
jgi:hypothetical protein